MSSWTIRDLEYWDARICEKVEAFGLECYPQEFEVCDHHEMLGYMAYSGMPSHYPHWSYGKAYEKLKTLYDYGVSGLPYEIVINSDPSIAYLMRDNTLCLQILTIAHVYGHNDFFRNNFTFRTTGAEHLISRFKAHADRVRSYVEDPSIGIEKVENILDAAHALSLQCRRNLSVRKLSADEERARLAEAAAPREDPFRTIHRKEEPDDPDLRLDPPSPEEDLLLCIAAHNPFLAEWERDLLTIVHEQAQYFIPQIETKIMNEGWASYWHREIITSLDLPQELHLEFLVRHNQVVCPHEGGLNPYHLGLAIWDDIRRRFDDPSAEERTELGLSGGEGLAKIFEVRSTDRDAAFLRRFLDEELMRTLDLFRYEPKENDLVISEVADPEGWRTVKETLLRNVGTGTIPVIRVTDVNYDDQRTLHLEHAHDGRDLQLEYAERTLEYVRRLWGRTVVLRTVLDGKDALLRMEEDGLTVKPLASG